MAGPLAGVRVLDLSQMLAAPGAAMMLADQGAEVIKIEPLQGDQVRHMFTNVPLATGESRSFLSQNRNKRGVALDIRHPEARAAVYRLVDRADVLIHNFRPGVAERLGYDYPTLHARNPRLVYARITGYGQEGPYAQQAGYDYLLQALSGILSRRRLPDGTPMRAGVFVADMSASMLLAFGVMLALWQRHATGEGCEVNTSLLQAALAMQNSDLVTVEQELTPKGPGSPQALNSAYRCGDGAHLVIGIFQDVQWQRLCAALDLPELRDDPRYATELLRSQNGTDLFDTLSAFFSTRPIQDWLDLLVPADVPCAPVLEWSQVFDHPQTAANAMFATTHHPETGVTRMVAAAVTLPTTPVEVRPAPLLGQETAAVLAGAGLSAAEIADLVAGGVAIARDA